MPLLGTTDGTIGQIDRLRRFGDAVQATALMPEESLVPRMPYARRRTMRTLTVVLPVDGSVRASHARALMHLLEQIALQLEVE